MCSIPRLSHTTFKDTDIMELYIMSQCAHRFQAIY